MKPGTHRRQVRSEDAVEAFERELRNPLGTLHGELDLIADRVEDLSPEVLASLRVMSRAIQRLEATVDGVAWVDEPPATPGTSAAGTETSIG